MLTQIKASLILAGFFIYSHSYSQKYITILQYKGVDDSVINEVVKDVKKTFKINVNVISGIDTVYTEDVHVYLKDVDKHFGQKVIGIVNTTLFHVCEQREVYGLANTGNKSCIMTVNDFVNLKEIKSVAIHELGHTYGLPHCSNINCYMSAGDGSLKSIDNTFFLCKQCKQKFKTLTKKLHHI